MATSIRDNTYPRLNALVIVAGGLPAPGVEPWWSGLGGGATTGANSRGDMVQGRFVDQAVIYFTPTNWDGVTQVEFCFQRAATGGGVDGSTAKFGFVEPSAMVGQTAGRFIDVLGDGTGRVVISAQLPVNKTLAIPVLCPGAQRFRFGLRAVTNGEARANFACACDLELVQTNTVF